MKEDTSQRDFALGEKYISEGKYDYAIGVLEQILSHSPENIAVRLKLAEVYEKKGNWDKALKILEGTIESSTEKHELSSLYEKIKEKKEVYKKVKSVIEAGEGGKSYIGDDDFVYLTKGNISIKFHIKNRGLDIERIFRTLKRIQKKAKEKLAYTPESIPVEIYNSDFEFQKTTAEETKKSHNSWIAGVYDGKIRVNSQNKETPEPQYLYVLLSHEYIHLIVDEITKGKCFCWLGEGLALFFSQELTSDYQERLIEAVKSNSTLPFEALEGELSLLGDKDVIRLAYAQSLSMVEYFIEKMGWDKIRHILDRLQSENISDILKGLSLNYYLLEKAWLRWLKSRQ